MSPVVRDALLHEESHRATYAAAAAEYEREVPKRREIISDAVDVLEAHLWRGARVLDVGCGVGAMTEEIARRGFEATGVDFVPEMIQSAERHRHAGGYVLGDFFTQDWGTGFDCVVAIAFIHLWPKDELPIVLHHFRKVVGVGGYVYTGSTDEPVSREGWERKGDYEGAPMRYRARYTEKELVALLRASGLGPVAQLRKTDNRGKRWRDWLCVVT